MLNCNIQVILWQLKLLIYVRVLDNLKDYALRAVVNAVDHLGTVAYKLTDLFEQQASEVSTYELKVARLNQVITLIFSTCILQRWNHASSIADDLSPNLQQIFTCQVYTDKEGLRQQQMMGANIKHHKHYILPRKWLQNQELIHCLITKERVLNFDSQFFSCQASHWL